MHQIDHIKWSYGKASSHSILKQVLCQFEVIVNNNEVIVTNTTMLLDRLLSTMLR